MAIRYESVAVEIVEYAYTLESGEAHSTAELVEQACSLETQEHVLADNDRLRRNRLDKVDAALMKLFGDYGTRRVECPLVAGSVERTYRAAFRLEPEMENAARQSVNAKRRVPELRDALYKISPQEFEVACRNLLAAIGCSGLTVTKFSKDDGVDVLGKLPMASALRPEAPLRPIVGGVSFFIYLQAKQHQAATPATGPEVDGVQGAWEWLRRAHTDRDLPDGLAEAMRLADYRAADPVLVILATTSRFTADARRKARSLGMLTLDGEQIAHVLVDARRGLRAVGGDDWELDAVDLLAT